MLRVMKRPEQEGGKIPGLQVQNIEVIPNRGDLLLLAETYELFENYSIEAFDVLTGIPKDKTPRMTVGRNISRSS